MSAAPSRLAPGLLLAAVLLMVLPLASRFAPADAKPIFEVGAPSLLGLALVLALIGVALSGRGEGEERGKGGNLAAWLAAGLGLSLHAVLISAIFLDARERRLGFFAIYFAYEVAAAIAVLYLGAFALFAARARAAADPDPPV